MFNNVTNLYVCINRCTIQCKEHDLLIKTVKIDTFLDVRMVACEGGHNTPLSVKGSGLLKHESSLRSAWYL